MNVRRLLFLMMSVLLLALTAAWAAADSDESQPPKPIKVSTVPYVVAGLDKVTVKFSDGSAETHQVSPEGLLELGGKSYPAVGLTPDQLTALVHRHLGHVHSVTIDEFRADRITVLGEVLHQVFAETSDGPMRVLDAIASANGFTPLANTRRVKLVRENAGRVEVYELDLGAVMKGSKSNQNMLVKPGDVITVPRNFL
jgi:polysaccharide export outer membrane protein